MNCEATPFLSMDGRAAEAIGFYERHLQAKVVFLATYEDMKKWDPSTIVREGQEHLIALLQLGDNCGRFRFGFNEHMANLVLLVAHLGLDAVVLLANLLVAHRVTARIVVEISADQHTLTSQFHLALDI